METLSHNLLTFLLNALWQVPLAAGVAALACRLMRDGPASHRHAVWVAALMAAICLPATSIRPHRPAAQLRADALDLPTPETAPPGSASAPADPARTSETRVVPFPQSAATLLGVAYLAFLLVRLGRFGWAWLRTVRLCHAASVPVLPLPADRVWRRCSHVLAIRNVELRSSAKIPSPVTTGVWRRSVILPDVLLAESSEDILTTAIGHEMAHIARHDFALNLLYELLFVPLSFHPAAWIIRRGIERTREMACDELVTRELLDRNVYAESMIGIAARMTGLPHPGCTLGVFDGDILEERIRRLLDRRTANLKRARWLFATGLSALAACAILASGLALTARAQSESQNQMKLGGEAYNRGDFRVAVEHFQNAVRTDPATVKPKLFLANALMQESYAENAPAGNPLMLAARRQYLDALARDPGNIQAMQGIVVVDMTLKELQEAQEWAAKLVHANAGDKVAYYTAGVLDWATVYPEFQRARNAAGGRQEDYFIPDALARQRLRGQYLTRVEDGIHMLEVALQLDPQYDDAMAYMNLLYRLKAGLVDSPGEASSLLAKADEWVGKALATRRTRPRTEPPGPPQLDVEGLAPGPASKPFAIAPPPPPPPPAPRGPLPPPAPLLPSEMRIATASPPPAGAAIPLLGQCWQVMGVEGTPAMDLFRQLRGKGFPAMMHDSPADHQVRVIAGPYFDQRSLNDARRELEAAGFRIMRLW